MLVRYRGRAFLGLVLIASQAFFYSGISFTYPLVLTHYFDVPENATGGYVLVMAVANFLGPLLLGELFDRVGRKTMIAATYALSGALILGTEGLFLEGELNAATQTLLWAVTFFFASAAASAGYLTVSEVFPLEMRALAIALFYAVGTAVGGLGAGPFRRPDRHRPAGCTRLRVCIRRVIDDRGGGGRMDPGRGVGGKGLEEVASPLTAEGADGLDPPAP